MPVKAPMVIALEGIMTMGAFTGILFLNMTGGRMSGQTQLFLAILISAATGAAFAFFHAYAAINKIGRASCRERV